MSSLHKRTLSNKFFKQAHCYYCGSALLGRGRKSKFYPKDHRATLDHVIPKAAGGRGEDNFVAACQACNEEKGCLSVDEFRAVVAVREGILKPEDIKKFWVFFGESDEAGARTPRLSPETVSPTKEISVSDMQSADFIEPAS